MPTSITTTHDNPGTSSPGSASHNPTVKGPAIKGPIKNETVENDSVKYGSVENLIEVTDLTVKMGNSTLVRDINLSIGRGEIVTLIGPNGSGKSTTIKAILAS